MSAPIKCPECMGNDVVIEKGDHHFTESGLDNVYLSGIDIWTCKTCGEKTVPIPRATDLMRCIGEAIILKPGLLSGNEIRFLRKNLMIKIVELAKYIGVDRSVLSRWENGREPHSEQADRLIRVIYAEKNCVREAVMKDLLERFMQKDEEKALPRYIVKAPAGEQLTCEMVASWEEANFITPLTT